MQTYCPAQFNVSEYVLYCASKYVGWVQKYSDSSALETVVKCTWFVQFAWRCAMHGLSVYVSIVDD